MEDWKPIPGYEGLYEASTQGRIRTAFGKRTSNARYPVRIWEQRVLKQKREKRREGGPSDSRVSLWKDGKETTCLVARLIALAWCEGYKDGYTVNHIDGNPENNASKNLEWVDLKANIRHGFENGLYKTQKHCALVSKDGNSYEFRSQAEASRFLNRNAGYINYCIKRKKDAYSTSGEVYKVAS